MLYNAVIPAKGCFIPWPELSFLNSSQMTSRSRRVFRYPFTRAFSRGCSSRDGLLQSHANPADEFSMDSVGPSYRIIGEYEKKFRDALRMEGRAIDEPLTVEKLRPHGYLLLNGHHRWAAAMRCGIKRVPIKIINCASESDIKTILEKSQHDKRAAIDLDEIIFRSPDYKYLEKKAFTFPFSLRFKQRIRLGIPALFYSLSQHGYDIWVYAAEFYSIDDIRKVFKAYSVHVDGIITGVAKREDRTRRG